MRTLFFEHFLNMGSLLDHPPPPPPPLKLEKHGGVRCSSLALIYFLGCVNVKLRKGGNDLTFILLFFVYFICFFII
jgi:hypothetical protein